MSAPAQELARVRTYAAAERTLLAWVRTAISLIAFGFGIPRIVADLGRLHRVDAPDSGAVWFGLVLILLGTLALASGIAERVVLAHRHPHIRKGRPSLALVLASLVALVDLFALYGVIMLTRV